MDLETFHCKHREHGDGWALATLFVQNINLAQQIHNLMSAISDFINKQTAFNARQGAAIDSVVTSVTGITQDVKTLNDKITELQNSAGSVTPEDQALIDQLETQADTLATKLEAASTALSALDAQTPPPAPAV